jgi:hypothetical protein
MVSRSDPATEPVDRVWVTNGATLPGKASEPLGTGDAPADPPAPTTASPTTVAVAPMTLTNFLVLIMVSLSSVAAHPGRSAGMADTPDKNRSLTAA